MKTTDKQHAYMQRQTRQNVVYLTFILQCAKLALPLQREQEQI